MTNTLRALLQPGYEPGDGSADGAQQVDGEWWHLVFGCDSLQNVVDNARSMLELPPGYIDPEHQGQDLEMLQAFYRACGAEGGTADEIHLRDIKAALATQEAALPAPGATHNPLNPAPLLWLLWNHLGSQSPVGQSIREYLGMGQFDRMTEEQIDAAKHWREANWRRLHKQPPTPTQSENPQP